MVRTEPRPGETAVAVPPRTLTARELRRLPREERDVILRADAADAADEYASNPALQAFVAERVEGGFLGGSQP